MHEDRVSEALNSDLSRVFVNEDGLATIFCSICNLTRQIPVTAFRGRQHSLKIRCKCGRIFVVNLEFRQQHRKNTKLQGIYQILDDTGGGRALIRDLSRNGIGFTVAGIHNIQVGQNLAIDFVLDNPKQTELRKQAVVRSVNMNTIGCEFKREQAFEKDLGFYLSD